MRKLHYLSILVGIHCQTATVRCPSPENPNEDTFGDLIFIMTEVKLCDGILAGFKDDAGNAILSECAATDVSRTDKKEEIKCKAYIGDATADCPDPPTGCSRKSPASEEDSDNVFKCTYTCTDSAPVCPDKYVDELEKTNDSNKLYCFVKSVDNCEGFNLVTDSQIVKTCSQNTCGYDRSPELTLTFDGAEIKNVFDAGSGNTADDHFGCSTSGYKPPNGCSCTTQGQTSSLVCGVNAYTNQCKTDNSQNCFKNIECYNGSPILDYVYNKCDVMDDELISYCTRDVRVVLPCGNFEHTCTKDSVSKKYNCICDADKNDCVAEWTQDDTCEAKNLDSEDPEVECEMTCFDDEFILMNCIENKVFVGTNWQCYDYFTKMKTTNQTTELSFIKTEKIKGAYDDSGLCSDRKCPDGYCICKDKVLDEAQKNCSALGDFYVSERVLDDGRNRQSDDELTEQTSIEYQCMFFMKDYAAINNINNVDSKSNCSELTSPKEGENAVCPVGQGGCHTMKQSESPFPAFGFYKCMCEAQCSYDCEKSSYDAVFDDNIDLSKNPYATYTCEKDNLVMIICTSIFVPLGVAGIAAGVYFFFFHESSEVAPVETDNELASKNSTEENSSEGDKEETQSEIAKDI